MPLHVEAEKRVGDSKSQLCGMQSRTISCRLEADAMCVRVCVFMCVFVCVIVCAQNSVQKRQEFASKLDQEVETQEEALRKKLVAARVQRKNGDKLEEKARQYVHTVDKMRDKAERLWKESERAKQKFVAEVCAPTSLCRCGCGCGCVRVIQGKRMGPCARVLVCVCVRET